MAFNFIKKVFSFGKDKEDASAPETEAVSSAAPSEDKAPAPAPDAPEAEAAHAFPADGDMQFTPETAPGEELQTPAPADEEHAGEPPIPVDAATDDAPVDQGDSPADAPAVAQMPEELASDPDVPAAPEPGAVEQPQDAELPRSTSDDADAEPTPRDRAAEDPLTPDEITADPDIPAAPVDSPAPSSAGEPRKLVVRDTVSDAQPVQAPEPVAEERGNWRQRLRKGLSRTSGQLTGQISGIFTKRKLDDETLEDLEDVLLQADLGVETAMRITDALSATRYGKDISPAEVQKVMADEITKVLGPVAKPLELDLSHKPHVILVVGVNGTGKTTTIGKLAAKLSAGGLKVTLAAGDTFRAAAIEQLKIWGDRTGSKVVSTKLGADAAGLAYEAFETARADGADVLIIDTAGRLQNRTELMDELAKVVRVIGKLDPDAPHTVLQTLDATTGQNALNQVEIFKNVAGVNGLVMTKLDGTARGGILVAIAAKHKLPVYFVGVGEGVDDLEPFEAADFASAIAGEPAGDPK